MAKKKKKPANIEIKISGLNYRNSKYNMTKEKFFISDKLPREYQFRHADSGFNSTSISFVGRFKFGHKDDYVLLAKALGFRTASGGIEAHTSVLVVDDIYRTNSVTIDKARQKGILILSEDEFISFVFNKNKNTGVINEKG